MIFLDTGPYQIRLYVVNPSYRFGGLANFEMLDLFESQGVDTCPNAPAAN
jgi:hypothetical protein